MLEKNTGELSSIGTEIPLLKMRLADLEKRQQELSMEISKLRKSSSTIRRIPLEVLREIFLYTIPLIPNPAQSSVDLKRKPWNMSYVCHSWRQEVLSFPRLWIAVSVIIPPNMRAGKMKRSLLLGLQLSRSSNLSLNVSIDYHGSKRPKVLTINHPFLVYLSPTTSRWQSLEIYARVSSMIELNSVFGVFPILKDFQVFRAHPESAVEAQLEARPGVVTCLQGCQQLDTLSCAWFDTPSLHFSLRWNALKTFQLTCTREMDLREIGKTLEKMLNLATFIVRRAYTSRRLAIVLTASPWCFLNN